MHFCVRDAGDPVRERTALTCTKRAICEVQAFLRSSFTLTAQRNDSAHSPFVIPGAEDPHITRLHSPSLRVWPS